MGLRRVRYLHRFFAGHYLLRRVQLSICTQLVLSFEYQLLDNHKMEAKLKRAKTDDCSYEYEIDSDVAKA